MFNEQPAPFNPSSSSLQAFSVSEINNIIADLLNSGLPGLVHIEGEISNLSAAASGHRYFSLKDNYSTISCALFRNTANRLPREILQSLKNGDKVLIKANISVYKPRGSYQLIINDIEPAGFGALAKAFIELKNKLEKAGLFDHSRKRPIPTWSSGIAVITSATGAAIRDVLTTLKRRAPFIPVTVYPTLVQGDTAPAAILSALKKANLNNEIDVILLVRGGGSLEDLMAFNNEQVALAVAHSRHPIISGVGHETDFSIVDFVSDYRAATPTAAAEMASPDKTTLQQQLTRNQQQLYSSLQQLIHHRQNHLTGLMQRLNAQHPTRSLLQQSQRLDELSKRLQQVTYRHLERQAYRIQQYQRYLQAHNPLQQLTQSRNKLQHLSNALQQAMQNRCNVERQQLIQNRKSLQQFPKQLDYRRQQLKGLKARLTLLSPLGILDRGYALAFDENNQLLRTITAVQKGETIRIRLADGNLTAVVSGTYND